MLLEWKADPEFQQFTIEHVIPLIFNIPFSPSFRQGDAESYQVPLLRRPHTPRQRHIADRY